MRTQKQRLVETLWDLITEDRDMAAPTSVLIDRAADSILFDIDHDIITRSEEV